MLNMDWSTNVYSDVASLAVFSPGPERTRIVAGNLVSSQVVVGEVRARRREEGLEVLAMIAGRAPVCVSEKGNLVVCASAEDQGTVTVHRCVCVYCSYHR